MISQQKLNLLEKCCILEKSRKNWLNLAKIQQNSGKICDILEKNSKISAKKSAIFNENFEIRDRCKGVHCVDLGESFPTSIYLQNLASIQPRTSLVKIARSPRTDRIIIIIIITDPPGRAPQPTRLVGVAQRHREGVARGGGEAHQGDGEHPRRRALLADGRRQS